MLIALQLAIDSVWRSGDSVREVLRSHTKPESQLMTSNGAREAEHRARRASIAAAVLVVWVASYRYTDMPDSTSRSILGSGEVQLTSPPEWSGAKDKTEP